MSAGDPAADLTGEVRALEELSLEGLRSVWRARYGAPPALRSPDMLRQILAWRIQAERFGGLDAQTRQSLKRRGEARDLTAGLGEGARLAREWRGRRYEAVAVAGGYAYEGKIYRSLSEVARLITGVRWNGPRFFGLRKESGRS
ncbi:DUF2924 domain-containing protein [Phenylobacterium sp.]|uniref:DUF2924 domain-containing protein n=2 Tax=Phenylobacterium sp. TaxID=1871053 RepID=UPI0025FBAE0D|nr:DUF2924 domain-containing protein [Phenylobacterium sp.]MCA3714702.1 DUF2924 domain-containing protein [Phenylobacterium sp.]